MSIINFNDSDLILRGNPKLKAAGAKDECSPDELMKRMEIMQKIIGDPIWFAENYFYINTLDDGKKMISIYPKQKDMILSMCYDLRVIVLASRQSGKSTAYTIFALWYCLTNTDKSILIVANRQKTAIDVLSRIKMAYEELPNWLKPGLVTWNSKTIAFDNGCSITAEATSESSGRGGTYNCVICDEFAFVRKSMESGFIQSVFPIISSSKTTKIIIVSTPNGMDNEFYRIYNTATFDKGCKDPYTWRATKIMWNEVPGRDEAWKAAQMSSFANNEAKFAQEYGCSFLGSINTMLASDTLDEMRSSLEERRLRTMTIQLHKDIPDMKLNIWYPPQENHSYIIGADPSMGTGDDYHAMCVLDITNAFDVKQVAGFYSNTMNPKAFAYMVAKTAMLYCNAYVMMEANGCSQVVLNALWNDFEYENIVSNGTRDFGIYSTPARKSEACLMFKRYIEEEQHKIEINDTNLMAELDVFEKNSKNGKMPVFEASNGHDDYSMALMWAYSILNMELLEQYYYVNKYVTNKIGEKMAYLIANCDATNPGIIQQRIHYLDEKIRAYGLNSEYNSRIESMNNSNDAMTRLLMNDSSFKILDSGNENTNESNDDDDEFHFGAFT